MFLGRWRKEGGMGEGGDYWRMNVFKKDIFPRPGGFFFLPQRSSGKKPIRTSNVFCYLGFI